MGLVGDVISGDREWTIAGLGGENFEGDNDSLVVEYVVTTGVCVVCWYGGEGS